MKCPGCDSNLVAMRHGDLAVDACSACDSIWFDRGELEAYVARPENARISSTAGSHTFERTTPGCLVCPRCSTDTLRVGTIDRFEAGVCSGCRGVWLSSTRVNPPSVVAEVASAAFEPVVGVALEVIAAIGDST